MTKIQESLNTKEIGMRVKQLRKSRGITQDELGIILGDTLNGKPLSRGQVSNLETGRRNLNIHQIKILADFFNVSIETLGCRSEAIETVDVLERAKIVFENDRVPLHEKQELYESIMKLYLDAREQIKNNVQQY
jgi:transcriptional regulator with XRE-family HTH domain